MTKKKQILTSGEAAQWCGVSLRTVLRWIERGELKAYQLPGRGDNRIRVEDLLEFLNKHRMPVPPELGSSSPRVLIVEDERSVAKLISETLKLEGYETRIAEDGFKAGAELGDFNPDLLTLDLKMPGLGGHDVIRFIRGSEQWKHLKILVVSGLSASELEKARGAGADDVLRKPVDYKALVEKVSALMSKRPIAIK